MLVRLFTRAQTLTSVRLARRTRAATFIEYALLAAIALALFFIFRDTLTRLITNLLGRLSNATS